LELATASWRFWVNRGLIVDGARWLTLALDACPERSILRARALSALAVLKIRQNRPADLIGIGDEIVSVLDELGGPEEQAHARHQRALLTFMAGEWQLAQAQIENALSVAAAFPAVVSSAEHFAGLLAFWRDGTEAARARFGAAVLALEEVPDAEPPFFITISLGWAVDERRDPPLPVAEESILFGRRVGAQQAAGHLRLSIALTERLSGRVEAALGLIGEAIARFRSVGDRYGEAYALCQQGHTLRWAGKYRAAGRCLLGAESIRRELRDQRGVAFALSGRAVAAASAGVTEDARTLGREALSMMERSSDLPGVMVGCVNLAIVEILAADVNSALSWLDRGIALHPVPGAHGGWGWLHLLRAHLLRRRGDPDGAAESAAAAQAVFDRLGGIQGSAAVQRFCKVGPASFGS
jgi:hypothetical protein